MGIFCKVFGHTIKEHTYGKYSGGTIDGINTEHGFYKWNCERCWEPIYLNVHFPKKEERFKNGSRVKRKSPL